MSGWPEIDPQILRLFIDGGEELVRFLWHALQGDTSSDDAKAKIDKIRRRAQEAYVRAMQDELEQQAAVTNLALQLSKLGPPQQHVLDSFDKIDPAFPKLNEILDIEEIKP
jgi:hypothetical protein